MLPLKDNTYAISQYNIIHNLIQHPYPNNHITSIYFPALKREYECFILSQSPQLWIAYYKNNPLWPGRRLSIILHLAIYLNVIKITQM